MNLKIDVIEKIKNDELVQKIADFAGDQDVYLVGGCIRDYFLGMENFDKDIVVKNSKKFAQNLAKNLDGKFIPLDEIFKIYRIVLKDKLTFIDIAEPMEGSIEKDLKRRDLTINSLAVNLKNFKMLDFTDGLYDLKHAKIKMISEENITDDALRILRAYRFMATLGFKIDKKFEKVIYKHKSKIKKSAQERINQELMKLFGGDFASKTLLEMDKTTLLEILFPVIAELKKVPPNSHHHLGLFEHSIETVRQIEEIYHKLPQNAQEHMKKKDFGGATRLAHLKLTAFLHDIGKFSTWTIDETGRHRFIKHNEIGAVMSKKLLKNMKFSKKQIEYVSKMIKYHIYPSNVIASPNLTDKVYMRFVRKMEQDAIDVIILAMADRLSARGIEITQEMVDDNINGLKKLMNFYMEAQKTLKPLPKLLTGNDIMEKFDIPPSPYLGELLKSLEETQLSGEVTTVDEAIKHVSTIIMSKNPSK